MTAVDGILLAAGGSRRMKRPKLLIPVRGKTVLDIALGNHVGSSLRSICVVVPRWLPEFDDAVKRCSGSRVEFLRMAEPGPMSDSLKAGWRHVLAQRRPEYILVSLADKPLVGPGTIDLLIRRCLTSGRRLCVPLYRGAWGHPVVLGTEYDADIMRLRGDRGARQVLEAHPQTLLEVEVEDDSVVFDVDDAVGIDSLKTRLDARA